MQTAHDTSPPVAAEGLVSGNPNFKNILSGIVVDTNGAVKWGRFVRVLANPAAGSLPTVELPNATGEVTGDTAFGFCVRSLDAEVPASGVFAGYASGDVCSVLRKGRIWVVSEDAVSTHMAPVFVRFTADANPIGGVRTDADGGEAVALPGSHFLGTCDAGGLVEIEVDIQD